MYGEVERIQNHQYFLDFRHEWRHRDSNNSTK